VLPEGLRLNTCDVLIIGGGPAGSSCARRLAQAGLDVRVLDRAQFPRDKTCAGWITPAVVDLVELDVCDYRRGGRTFQPIMGFRTSRMGSGEVASCYDHPVSFGIRRCEFDDYLLRRSGAGLHLGEPVRSLCRDQTPAGGRWIVNDRLTAPMLVGAGGHYCPVARYLEGSFQQESQREGRNEALAEPSPGSRQGGSPAPPARVFLARGRHAASALVVAQEIEFVMTPEQGAGCRIDPEVPELYFCGDLEGYGWCFRKEEVLNIGLGRRGGDGRRLSAEVQAFGTALRHWGKIDFDPPARLHGHAYLLSDGSPRRRVGDGVLLIGDAAGVAYPASGEGIRPAVETGLLAAETILAGAARSGSASGRGSRYSRDRLDPYRLRLEARFGKPRPPRPGWSPIPPGWQAALGGCLLGWPWFARHVVMERWFLHTHEPPLWSRQ
jgi:flavin-dependent dehydrogenase